jgi:hypothetical protein
MIAYLIGMLDWNVVSALKADYLLYILSSALISSLFLGFMALRWKLLLASSSRVVAPFFQLYRWYLVGMFFSIFLPGAIGGDVMRARYAAKGYGIGIKQVLMQIASERLFGLTALVIIFLIAFPMVNIKHSLMGPFSAVLACVLGVALFVAAKFLVSRKVPVSYGMSGLLLLLSMLGQFADVLILFLLQRYFELSLPLEVFMLIMPVVFVATVLPVSMGGLGVREGVMVALLGAFGVNSSTAVVLALSVYLAKVLTGLLGALLFMSLPEKYNTGAAKAAPEAEG